MMCSMSGVEQGRSYLSVMGGMLMLAVIVSKIPIVWAPIDVEHVLLGSVLYPIKIHVYSLGSFLFHYAICKTPGCSVVHLDWVGWLRVPHFDECMADGDAILTIHVADPYFCLSCCIVKSD